VSRPGRFIAGISHATRETYLLYVCISPGRSTTEVVWSAIPTFTS